MTKKKPPLTRLWHVSELQKLLCCIFCTNSFLDSFHCSQSELLISWAKPTTMPPLVRNTPTLQNVFCWFWFSSGKSWFHKKHCTNKTKVSKDPKSPVCCRSLALKSERGQPQGPRQGEKALSSSQLRGIRVTTVFLLAVLCKTLNTLIHRWTTSDLSLCLHQFIVI